MSRPRRRDGGAVGTGDAMRIVIIGPHAEPDTAPTGRMLSGIARALEARGHEVHVVTSLPWYRDHAVEAAWAGRWRRVEKTPSGSITRVHPFPGGDRRNLVRRALGFIGFSAVVGLGALRCGRWMSRVDVVLAMSPPLTLGPTGRVVAWLRRARSILNVQDIFPDAAIETGAITNARVIAAARWLERRSYALSDAVTVLSDEMAANVRAKVGPPAADRSSPSSPSSPRARRRARPRVGTRVEAIANFVDTEEISPGDRLTAYRAELGIDDRPLVMYAGNVGFSQSLELMIAAARALPEVAFVINGDGSARTRLEAEAVGLANLRFVGYQSVERLGEVLASADLHVVALRSGLGAVSVPSKIYSILAAGRAVVASIDPDTEIPRLLERSRAGVAVPPDSPEDFVAAVARLVRHPDELAAMGAAGRRWVVDNIGVDRVAAEYEVLMWDLARGGAVGGDAARRRGVQRDGLGRSHR
jgi:colanic acid biosynthesis glycosyl transferase WcaI